MPETLLEVHVGREEATAARRAFVGRILRQGVPDDEATTAVRAVLGMPARQAVRLVREARRRMR